MEGGNLAHQGLSSKNMIDDEMFKKSFAYL